MTVALSAFLLGASGQQVPSRQVRLSLGATWRPSSAALGVASGVVYGPAGGMGEATLASPTQLNVNPFVAVVQGTHSAVQGQYHVPNDTLRSLAITAQHASQYRRALYMVTVDDSEAAGVASSPTTDRARLHIVDGPLEGVGPGSLPAVPANSLVLGEVAIPPTGNTVTVTPYNPRTVARGGILPVFNDTSLLPGHGGAVPTHDGEARWHPVNGFEVGVGGVWKAATHGLPVFMGYMNATSGVVAANTWGKIPLQVESIDTHGMHTGANVFCTVPAGQGGIYEVSGQIAFTAFTSNARYNTGIFINDALADAIGHGSFANNNPTTGFIVPIAARPFQLNAGDTIGIAGRSNNTWQAWVEAATDEVTSFCYIKRVA